MAQYVATTPYGTFTRKSDRKYAFVAVTQYGERRSDPRSLRANWSATREGAEKLLNREGGYPNTTKLGVYPIKGFFSDRKINYHGLSRSTFTQPCGCVWVCDINGDMAAEYKLCPAHEAPHD